MEISLKQLRSLLKTLEEGGASEFEYQDDKYRVRLAIGGGRVVAAAAAAPAPAPAPVAAPAPAEPGGAKTADDDEDPGTAFVTSPFVGTFYRAPAPEADAFVDVGSAFRAGQTMCIVEAMKLMNEIEAEFAGTVLEVLVDNGATVEFGQKLFKVKRS